MAAKKKSKKAKSRKKAKKPIVRKTKKSKKKVVKKVAKKKASKAKAKPAAKPAAAPAALPGERIGVVTHYYSHLTVAIVKLEAGMLRVGDTIHVKGHTSDFRQNVDSMELDHAHVDSAFAGQSVGLRVKDHAREHDVVYKVAKF